MTAEEEILKKNYAKVVSDPEMKARLDFFISWVLDASTHDERQRRVQAVQSYAEKKLAQLRGKN